MAMLPYLATGEVRELGGTVVESAIPIQVWPVQGRASTSGQVYDHEGEAHIDAWEHLKETNRAITVGPDTYRIVSAQRQEFLPHIWLLLRRVEPSGSH